MNQVAIREEVNFDVILKDVETMQRMCKELMKTKHYQKMGEDGIFAIVQASKSLGMNPLEGLNGALYYIQGKVGMGSETMNALIRRKGHSIVKDVKSDNTICILHGKRADNGDTWTVRFTLDDAKRAGLLKNMYDKYPGVMLYNRAMSMLARQLFPDVIHNVGYCKEELEEIATNKNTDFSKLPEEPFEETTNTITLKFIDSDQIETISHYLSLLDEETKTNFFSYLKRRCNANKINEIAVPYYDNIISLLKMRADQSKKAKVEEEVVLEKEDQGEEDASY
jgi:hypothetical protein